MSYWDTAGDIGDVLGEIAANRAKGRVDAAGMNQSQDRTAYEAARLNLQAPAYRTSNAVKGDILSNAQDFAYGAPRMVGNIPVPTSTGGLRPSIFSPQTRALGAVQSRQALQGGLTNNGNVASVTPLPQASGLDKGLGILGTAGALAGALKGGGGSGGSFNISDLIDSFKNRGTFGTPGDVTGNYNPENFAGIDPETGLYADQGPTQAGDNPNAGGLEDFWAWLAQQNAGGGADPNLTQSDGTWGEW